jgi:hypothetical protein
MRPWVGTAERSEALGLRHDRASRVCLYKDCVTRPKNGIGRIKHT